jgi:Cytochrome c7 and related cytochrome c
MGPACFLLARWARFVAQVFGPGSNSLARFSLVGALAGLAFLFAALELYVRSPYVTSVGLPVDQPVPFSHKHHVTDDGIDCRYCHTTVETSSFAGMPSTQTCMNCHSQIWAQSPVLEPVRRSFLSGQPIQWNRVNNVAGFVYFDHSIHVQKGVGCSSCHGRVDEMPLTYKAQSFQMSFCLECHQNPAHFIRPRSEVFNMAWQPPADQDQLGRELVDAYHVQSKISCSTCHR